MCVYACACTTLFSISFLHVVERNKNGKGENTLFILYITTLLILFKKKIWKWRVLPRLPFVSLSVLGEGSMCASHPKRGCRGHFSMRIEQTALPSKGMQFLGNFSSGLNQGSVLFGCLSRLLETTVAEPQMMLFFLSAHITVPRGDWCDGAQFSFLFFFFFSI